MKFGVNKIIGKTVGASLFFLGLIFLPAMVQAAGCCVYIPDGSKAPDWLKALPDKIIVLNQKNGKCPKVADIPALVNLANYYEEPATFGSESCLKTTDETVLTALSVIQKNTCCVLRDKDNKPILCKDKSDAESDMDSCALILGTKAKDGASIGSFNSACSETIPCKELAASKITAGTAAAGTTASTAAAKADPNAPTPWKKAECESVKIGGEPRYVWLPPSDKPSLTEGNYCFVRPLKANLEISIGSVGTIKSIGEYINVVYKYVIGFGVLAIVLTIIVSGFQWMVSGIADQIGAAKKRIGNALLGLLLLLGAHIVIYTINPQILQLRAPLIKAIRPKDFGVAKSNTCDPDVQPDSCVKQYGDNFYCKPTFNYIDAECSRQARNYQMLFTGVVASMVALPAVATAVSEGAVGSAASSAVNWVSGQLTWKGAAANVATEIVSDEVGKKIGKVVAPLVAGVGFAYLVSGSEKATPAKGYCTEMKQDQADYKVCRFDKECASGACLLTADLACGTMQLGICVSGQLKEPCAKGLTKAMETLYSKKTDKGVMQWTFNKVFGAGWGEKIWGNASEREAKIKEVYGCKTGGAHCVGKIGNEPMLGFCSDGTEAGMGCDDSLKCGGGLVCVKNFCREAGYFNDKGGLKQWGATCFTAHDCGFSQNLAVSPAVCLKVDANHAWMSGFGTTGTYDKEVVEATKVMGKCVFDSPVQILKWGVVSDIKIADNSNQPCFVNLSSCADSSCEGVSNLIQKAFTGYYSSLDSATKAGFTSELATRFKDGVKFEIVGCGWASQSWHKKQKIMPPDTGYCQVPIGSFFETAINNGTNVVGGLCVTKNGVGDVIPGFSDSAVADTATINVNLLKPGSMQPVVTVRKQGAESIERVPSYYYIDSAFQLF